MIKNSFILAIVALMIMLALNLHAISATLNVAIVVPSTGTIIKPITRLHTENSYIKNGYNELVQLTGVGIQEFMAGVRIGPNNYPEDENGSTQYRDYINQYFQKIKDAGANHVRISIKLLQKWYNTTAYPMYIPNIDMCVQEAAKVKLYIYFCFHYGSNGDDGLMQALIDDSVWGAYPNVRTTWMDAAKNITLRYKDYPNVMGYQVWAEPGWARFGREYLNQEGNSTAYAILSEEWAAFNLDTARAIHSVNPNAIVFVTSPGYYSYKNVGDYYYNNPLPEPNIVYAWQDYHTYATDTNFWRSYNAGNYTLAKQQQENWLIQKALRMANKGYPVHLVEFGFYKDFSDVAFERQMASDMYDVFRQYGQGWTQFCWGSGTSQWYVLDSVTGGLTQSGELMSQNFAPLP